MENASFKDNLITEMQKSPRLLNNLHRADLSDNRLSGIIPDVFFEPNTINELDFSGNAEITALPEHVPAVPTLQRLILSNTGISTLPEWVDTQLHGLQELGIAGLHLDAQGLAVVRRLRARGVTVIDQ